MLNYLLAIIFKQYIIFNFIYKLSAIIYKPIIIYNDPQLHYTLINTRFPRTLNTTPAHEQTRLCTYISSTLRTPTCITSYTFLLILLTYILTWASESFVLQVLHLALLTNTTLKADVWSPKAYLSHIHPNVCQLRILVSIFGARHGAAVKHTLQYLIISLSLSPMFSTRSGLRRETLFKGTPLSTASWKLIYP